MSERLKFSHQPEQLHPNLSEMPFTPETGAIDPSAAVTIGHLALLDLRAQRADRKAENALEKADKVSRKAEFHQYLQAKTDAYLNGTPEEYVNHVAPQTWRERQRDKRVEKRLDRLAEARHRRKNADSYGKNQTYGLRPAIHQQLRLREAGMRHKAGELTATELNAEKLAIRASRATGERTTSSETVAVRGKDQRRSARETSRRAVMARMTSKPTVSGSRRLRQYQSALTKAGEKRAQAQSLRLERQNLLASL